MMCRVFLISAITGNGPEQAEQVNIILRHLAARGNDVILYEFSAENVNDNCDVNDMKKQLNIVGMIEGVDAVVLITDEYCAYLTQVIQGQFKTSSKKLKRSSNVWFHNGVCCTILGGSVRKSRVAKQLWEVLSEQNDLDLSDLFPYGSPRSYVLDYTKETAQPTVV